MIGAYSNGIPEDGNLSIYAHDNCEIKSYHIENERHIGDKR